MANGDVKQDSREFRIWALQDGTLATSNGVWVETGPYGAGATLDVSGITTATVQLCGSNASTKPADTAHGEAIGLPVTANQIDRIETVPKYVKARITAHTTGTVYAILKAYRTV